MERVNHLYLRGWPSIKGVCILKAIKNVYEVCSRKSCQSMQVVVTPRHPNRNIISFKEFTPVLFQDLNSTSHSTYLDT